MYSKTNCPIKKKEEIWLSPLTKAPTLTENPKSNVITYMTPKKFDHTMIADRLRTASRSNNSHPTGVVTPILTISFAWARTINCNGKQKMMNIRTEISVVYIRCADDFLSYRYFPQNQIHTAWTWLKVIHMYLPWSYCQSMVLQKQPIYVMVS